MSGDEKMTVQLIGPDGQVVAQHDRDLNPGQISAPSSESDVYGILIPGQLALGDYRLIVALYRPTEDGSQRISTAAGADAATLWQASQ